MSFFFLWNQLISHHNNTRTDYIFMSFL